VSYLRRLINHRGGLGIVGLVLGSLLLTACGGADDSSSGSAETGDTTSTEAEASGEDASGSAGGTITIGMIPWQEDIAVTELWRQILTEQGYEVETTQPDVAPLYQGLADGDIDVFLDAWLPATHADYWERFSDDLEEVGTWYDAAPLTWVVPSYVEDVNSIADLKGKADTFDGEVIGIEAGSGLMRISREEVVPTYELDGYNLVEGSTSAMLASLEKAVQNEEPIAVTLWEPHYAYAQWDLKNLEDPEGALGEPDSIKTVATKGFSEEHPEAAAMLANFTMTGEQLSELELMIEEGDLESAVSTWIEENQDVVDGWLEG
jgi:glycine betaine/proline transport system substrate-binding protein